MVPRNLNISKSSSFFLFGARGTGKSTYLNRYSEIKFELVIDLLKPAEFARYSMDPEILSREVAGFSANTWIAIDEVQRVPQLLDLVHYHIEKDKLLFAMTGSSARKLKRGAANLLAGRAFKYELHPFTYLELGAEFNLSDVLHFGSLPKVVSLKDPQDKNLFLESYALTYVEEEVWNEHIIRSLPPFRRFLQIAAQMNGEIVNFSKIAASVGVEDKTIKSYFSILEDTYLGFFLEPYNRSVRKQQTSHPKFYFFDLGVKSAVDGTLGNKINPGSSAYGRAFEHFIVLEVLRRNAYTKSRFKLSYLRTKDGAEVDLIVSKGDKAIAIVEIKSTTNVSHDSVKPLRNFQDDFKGAKFLCLSNDEKAQSFGEILALHWRDGIEEIFSS